MSQESITFLPPYLKDSDQRYTPAKYIGMVAAALGGIDLDPTADPTCRVMASFYITEEMDCFKHNWIETFPGNLRTVYMNPPYSNAHPFIETLVKHLDQSCDLMAITLTHQGLMQTKKSAAHFRYNAKAYCFPHKRINFDYPSHLPKKKGNDRDSLFAYWGSPDRLQDFVEIFGQIGTILMPPK